MHSTNSFSLSIGSEIFGWFSSFATAKFQRSGIVLSINLRDQGTVFPFITLRIADLFAVIAYYHMQI